MKIVNMDIPIQLTVGIHFAYIAAILFSVFQGTKESNFQDYQDYYDDNVYDKSYYKDYNYDHFYNNRFQSDPECTCGYYLKSTHEALCGFSFIETIPHCIPTTVQILDFEGNRLEYQPRQFERFKDLQKLDLSLNNFSRLGNDSFVGLSQLQELDLSNELRHHPSSPTTLFYLRDSGFSWNHITEIRKDTFTGLPNLRRLDLRKNPITLIDSFAFSLFDNLHELNLSNTWVTNAHSMHFSRQSFEGLSSLRYLGLESINMFNVTSFPAGIFKPLKSLQQLNLRKFCRSPDTKEENCPNLYEQIGSIPSLQHLYIDAERIICLGPGFKLLKNLKEIQFLAVLDVHIKSLSNKTFENLHNSPLSKIAIKPDQTTHGRLMVDEVLPNTFATFTDLQVLDISLFSNSESSCFGEMGNLSTGLQNTMIKHLRISFNNLMCKNNANELPDLTGTELEILDLSHSSVTSVSSISSDEYGEFFNKLPKLLKYLYLQHNQIDHVNLKHLHSLEQLRVLNMSNQNQWTATREKKSIQVYKKDSFDTDGYQMEIEDSKAIGDTDGYQMEIEDSKAIGDTDGYQMEIEDSKAIGDTDGYQMEIEDSKAIGDTDGYQMEIEDSKAIGETDGYQIEIEDSKAIKTDTEDADYFYWSPAGCYPLPPNLRTIDISNSGLFHGFTEMFCDTNNSLKVLNLANQKNFHDIDRNTLWKSLKALLQLEDLNLNGNGIQHIPSAAFTKLTNMKFLSLANNNLVVVSFEVDTLVNLKKLDLSSNNLQYVTDEFAIQIENINENQAKPEPTPFEQLPGAEQFLDYMNSHLGYEMEMENIVEITQHLFVDLRNNPLICDCERMRFVKWMRDTSLFDDKSQISRSIWQMSCTFKNGSLLQLVDAPQIYALLQQECEENIQSLGEKNKDSHNSLSLLILVAVLGLIIFGLLAVILVLLRRQRKQLGGNHDNSIVLT